MTFTTDTIVDAPTDAIVDAETGCLLRLISYSGDTLAIWWELDDISTEPADPDEFRVHVPPGTRTVEETGNLFADAAAVMPGVKGPRSAPPPRPSTARPAPSPPPGASWTTCAAIARQEHAALITVAAGARGRLRSAGGHMSTREHRLTRCGKETPQINQTQLCARRSVPRRPRGRALERTGGGGPIQAPVFLAGISLSRVRRR